MTFRSLDDWLANGSKPSDLKPGDRILVRVNMNVNSVPTIVEYWPCRVVQAPSADLVLVESFPKMVRGRLTALTFDVVLVERAMCLGPWRWAKHDDHDCGLHDCLDFSHYVMRA
jgi:hypothetical protein